MKSIRSRNLLKSAAVKLHDMLFAHLVRSGLVLCMADDAGAGGEGGDSMLTGGEATADTAATDGQAAGTQDAAGAQGADGKTQGDADGKGAETDGKKGGDKPAGAPEKYEFKAPEGLELDEQMLGEFTPVLKELNLTQEQAQKVVDFAPKLVEKTVQQTTAKVLDAVGMTDRAKWAEAAKTDKELGGDKLTENLAVARKALDAFGSPELRAVLNKTGLGNHPELIRAFYRAGKAISEDSYVPGGKTTTVNPAARLYDKSNMNP